MEYKVVTDVMSVLPYGEVKQDLVVETITKTVVPLLEPTVTDPSTFVGGSDMLKAEYNMNLKRELGYCDMCAFHGRRNFDNPHGRIPRTDSHKNKDRKRVFKEKRLMAYRAWDTKLQSTKEPVRDYDSKEVGVPKVRSWKEMQRLCIEQMPPLADDDFQV